MTILTQIIDINTHITHFLMFITELQHQKEVDQTIFDGKHNNNLILLGCNEVLICLDGCLDTNTN